eukprot:6700461-Alexandrium_andersonii.AAC.2
MPPPAGCASRDASQSRQAVPVPTAASTPPHSYPSRPTRIGSDYRRDRGHGSSAEQAAVGLLRSAYPPPPMRCLAEGERSERPLADALPKRGPSPGFRPRHLAQVHAVDLANSLKELLLAPNMLLEDPVEVSPALPIVCA